MTDKTQVAPRLLGPITLDENGFPLPGRLYAFKGWPEEIVNARPDNLKTVYRNRNRLVSIGEPLLFVKGKIERRQSNYDPLLWKQTYFLTFLTNEVTFDLVFEDYGKFITNFGELITSPTF